eukprot:COSAG02_NODE_422_length_22587_cov_10.209089_16_plen_82_part_00
MKLGSWLRLRLWLLYAWGLRAKVVWGEGEERSRSKLSFYGGAPCWSGVLLLSVFSGALCLADGLGPRAARVDGLPGVHAFL